MKSPIPDYLNHVLDNVRSNEDGKPAAYIEPLAKADTSKLAIALAMVDGTVYSAGDDDVEFTIQSISKAFVYALAIEDAGLKTVLSKCGVEPSGDAFNQLSLHKHTNRPMNPMINAGAITVHALVVGPNATHEERCDRILDKMSRMAGRKLRVDEDTYQAELQTANRNIGIAYMLKAAGMITCDPYEAVKGYIRQCSILVTVKDLARMSATLVNGGVEPLTADRIIPSDSVRQVLSVMATCGMYDAAGDWLSTIGIPAKSGVGGGIIGALPGQVGIAVFSPRLDDKGTSVRGQLSFEQLSQDMGLHMMSVSQLSRATVSTSVATIMPAHDHDHSSGKKLHPNCNQEVVIFSLKGAVRFSGAERLTRAVARELGEPDPNDPGSGAHADACAVVFSFKEVYSLSGIARRIIHEDIARILSTPKPRAVIVLGDEQNVLRWDKRIVQTAASRTTREPKMVMTDAQAREYIGGVGCRAIAQDDDAW